jgi:hypothetical protein
MSCGFDRHIGVEQIGCWVVITVPEMSGWSLIYTSPDKLSFPNVLPSFACSTAVPVKHTARPVFGIKTAAAAHASELGNGMPCPAASLCSPMLRFI